MNSFLFPKRYKCPICQNEFSSYRIKHNAYIIDHRDEDFCTHYKHEVNPYLYGVVVCPQCGYSATESYYNEMTLSRKKIIEDTIRPRWVSQDFGKERTIRDAIITHKLAIYQGELLHYPITYLASLCLKIAWLYRLDNKLEQEQEFLQLALSQFIKAYSEEKFPQLNMELFDCSYLAGELNRRLGNFKEALVWFDTTLKIPGVSLKIEKLTREQWAKTKEAYKSQAIEPNIH